MRLRFSWKRDRIYVTVDAGGRRYGLVADDHSVKLVRSTPEYVEKPLSVAEAIGFFAAIFTLIVDAIQTGAEIEIKSTDIDKTATKDLEELLTGE